MKQQPWEKLSISELSYLMAYTQGYNSAHLTHKPKTSYKAGTSLRKAYNRGRKDAKSI